MTETVTAAVLLGTLIAREVRTVFALAGGAHTHLLAALEAEGVTIVPSRHEAATVIAADGYARVTGRPGVALVIADQGLPNAVAGLANAHHARSPVILLVARLPIASEETDAEVEPEPHHYAAPVSKWSRTVHEPERLADYFAAAWKHATAGAPGPVVLAFDVGLLPRQVRAPRTGRQPPRAQAAPRFEDVAVAAALFAAASRPLIVAGAQALRDRAGPALQRCAELGVPVLGNGLGRGLVAEDGRAGHPWPYAQIAAHRADLVLFAGARPTRRLGFGLPPRFAPDARAIQIDAAPETLHRNRPMDVAIAADVGLALAALADVLARDGRRWSSAWLAEALAPREARVRATVAEHASPGDRAVHPLVLATALEARIPRDAIVVGDGADLQNWMYGVLRARPAPAFLEHHPLGAMGVGTPLAIGAAAGARELASAGATPRRVVLVTGDGAFGFYPFEFQSAAQAGLPITVVIGNDGAWGTELHSQLRAVGRAYNTALQASAYEHVATAFGCRGHRVETVAELGPALDAALADARPSLVNVLIDPQAGRALQTDPLLNMILFDDLAAGRGLLDAATAPAGDPA